MIPSDFHQTPIMIDLIKGVFHTTNLNARSEKQVLLKLMHTFIAFQKQILCNKFNPPWIFQTPDSTVCNLFTQTTYDDIHFRGG